tara:strand:- start:148 stop:1020 length:873 start_codon:yes stop_codon:yes gene_type:complete
VRDPLKAPSSPPILKGNERLGPPPLLSEKQLRSGPGFSIFIGLFAVVAFCLIAWFGIYKDNIINNSEQLPVVAAIDKPIRIRPTEPGGMKVPHQDKLILKELVNGEKQSSIELLLPKPEVPLSFNKKSMETSKTVVNSNTVQSSEKSAPSSKLVVAEKINDVVNSEKKQQVDNAPKIAKNIQARLKKEKTGTGNRKKSPMRTSDFKYRIQLASVKSDKLARVAWKKYRQKFSKSLRDLEPYIEKVLIPAKGTFYRVQAGVFTKIAAQNICSVLINKKQPCIITRVKSGGG